MGRGREAGQAGTDNQFCGITRDTGSEPIPTSVARSPRVIEGEIAGLIETDVLQRAA
jgi:hypothetical protein